MDAATLQATLALILGYRKALANVDILCTESSLQARRALLQKALDAD